MIIPKGRKVSPSPSGDQYHVLYKTKVNVDGTFDLIPDGKEDIQEMINSYRESTDMQYILKQLALGNTSVVDRSPGFYGDFTNMPKTMTEAMQLMIDAEKAFYELPVDVRNNFDNSVNVWLATAGEEDWAKKMNLVSEAPIEEEVKSDVS